MLRGRLRARAVKLTPGTIVQHPHLHLRHSAWGQRRQRLGGLQPRVLPAGCGSCFVVTIRDVLVERPDSLLSIGYVHPMDERLAAYRLLSRWEVAMMLNVSVTTLWRMVRREEFPPPIRVSPGRVAWPASSVLDWIDERMDGARGD